MIRIRFREKHGKIISIETSGHANSDEYGKDLVCAGVSTTLLSAINALDELYGSQCSFDVFQKGDDNRVYVEVKQSSDDLQAVLKFVLKELDMIAQTYPEFVAMERIH